MITGEAAQRAARCGLFGATVALACAVIPWSGPEALLTQRPQAAFVAFTATTLLSFLSFPNHRRSDLALGLLVMVGFFGLIPKGGTGVQALQLLTGCAMGVLVAHLMSHIEGLRAQMRNQPEAPLLRSGGEERRTFWALGPLSAPPSGRS